MILTNKGGTRLTGVLAYNAYDRLLGLEPVPWNQRNKDEVARERETQQKNEKEADADRKPNTQPSHALADYVGEFEHPGYGVLTIWQNSGKLRATFNGLNAALRHYHFDVFEAEEGAMGRTKFTFELNGKGDIEQISVPLQSGVSDIVFTRKPKPAQQTAGSNN